MNPDLHLVENLAEVESFLRWLDQPRAILAIDTETGGLNPWADRLRLVQFGDANSGWALSYEDWRAVISEALKNYDRPVVYFNSKFDQHFLEHHGLTLPSGRVHDVQVMAHLLDTRWPPYLKGLAKKFIDPRAAVKDEDWDWDTVPVDYPPYWTYAALDVVLTARLAELFYPQVQANFQHPYNAEMQVLEIVRQMENKGVLIDRKYAEDLSAEWTEEIAELEDKAFQQYSIENLGSDDQVRAALLADGWQPETYTPTGKAQLDHGALERAERYLAEIVLRYRRLVKWKGTYLDQFLARADKNDRLHANVRSFAAKTSRMSITDPPMQTLPRGDTIRNAILADPGHVIISIDFSQIEARILAHYVYRVVGDRTLLDMILSGQDIHNNTATALYGPNFTDDQRSVCKNGLFALVYGAGIARFAKTVKIPYAEAKFFYDNFAKIYPGVKQFMDTVVIQGRYRLKNEGMGYITLPSGRRPIADDWKLYALTNYLIQGRAAEVLKDVMIELDKAGFTQYMLLPIHDEILFQFKEEEADEKTQEALEIMQDFNTFDVPLTAKAGPPMKRWSGK